MSEPICGAPCAWGGEASTRKFAKSELGWLGHCNRVVKQEGDKCWQHADDAPQVDRTCRMPECDNPIKGLGLCNKHYLATRPNKPRKRLRVERPFPFDARGLARFMAKVVVDDAGCWRWIGYKDSWGYGFFLHGRIISAHRASYQHFIGPIPEGLELDHLCRVRDCCNPEHLEAVTHQVNILRQPGHALAGSYRKVI